MLYRQVGRTGMKASIIGLGAEHLDGKPYEVVEEVVHAAIDNEINIMDAFMPGADIRQKLGRALRGRRDKMLIQGHVGSVDLTQQYDVSRDVAVCEKYFEELLKYLETDYIDFGMMFFIDSEEEYRKVFDTGYITYVEKLKREGKIRAIGTSSHNPVIAKKIVETGVVDMLMFSINLAFDMTPSETHVLDALEKGFETAAFKGLDPVRSGFYSFCESKGVGITVMKSLGAGKLISAEHTPFNAPMTAAQCIHYALTRPAVVSALVGCQTREQVLEAVNYLNLTDEEKDYSPFIGDFKSGFSGSCVYCNHCLPCPSAINVAAVNRLLDAALLSPGNIPESVRAAYKELLASGADCIACGSCEGRCPFGVPVISNMQKAAELFN